jgi:hypothetical protein
MRKNRGGDMISESEEELHLYQAPVPDFVKHELDNLYGARYATWPHFATQCSISTACTFTISQRGKVTAILVFTVNKNRCTVMNEGISIDSLVINKFTEFMFRENAALNVISINAVDIAQVCLSRPFHCTTCAADLVMPLPATHAWMNTLSAQCRSQLRRNMKRIKNLDASFSFEVSEGAAVQPQDIESIVALGHARMAAKRKKTTIDAREQQNIVDFVKARGFVGVIRIKGQICAGVILYKLGKNYALRTLAHDRTYDQYSIGTTALVLTIQSAAEQQEGGTFFFGWGNEGYKYRLGGRRRELSRLVIYRTPLAVLRNSPLAVSAMRIAASVRARFWLHDVLRKRVVRTMKLARSMMRPA